MRKKNHALISITEHQAKSMVELIELFRGNFNLQQGFSRTVASMTVKFEKAILHINKKEMEG